VGKRTLIRQSSPYFTTLAPLALWLIVVMIVDIITVHQQQQVRGGGGVDSGLLME
jgi:hypothetical protein